MQSLYLLAGVIMPIFYVPQILSCIRDSTGLKSFSVSKSMCQLLLRVAMLPFLVLVENHVILGIALFDIAGRVTEFVVAIGALRRQKWSWGRIASRVSPAHTIQSFMSRIRPGTMYATPDRPTRDGTQMGDLSESVRTY